MMTLRTRLAIALGACALLALILVALSPDTHRALANPLTGIATISAGETDTCAITTATGGVVCWGFGYGAFPTSVPGLSSGIATSATGLFHACALSTAGGVKCWSYGSSATDVAGLTSGVTQIAAEGDDGGPFCARTSAGGVKCWAFGSPPADVAGLTGGVAAIGTGVRHACAIMTTGAVKCWGANAAGQLGDGTLNDSYSMPVNVVGLSGSPVAISAGEFFTCALMGTGGVKCWGEGYGLAPVDAPGLTSGVLAISAGAYQLCATLTGNALKCAGENQFGQLGDGTTTDRTSPIDVVGLGSATAAVDAGVFHTCALTTAGAVKCWGLNNYSQLGDGTTTNRLVPFDVAASNVKPTPTATSCPLSGCPTPTQTSTPPPNTGIDFSIGIDADNDGIDDCSTTDGPAKCSISAGAAFTLKVYLNSLPPELSSYTGIDIDLAYAGVGFSGVVDNLSWPDCVLPAHFFSPGSLLWGCSVGTFAPPSTYIGVIGTGEFNCTAAGAVTLVHGPANTDINSPDLLAYGEPLDTTETLTINCPTPTPTLFPTATRSPTATSTPHPPPLGGVAQYPNVSSGTGAGLFALIAAATALTALAAAAVTRRLAVRRRRTLSS